MSPSFLSLVLALAPQGAPSLQAPRDPEPAPPRPNVLLLMMDQLAFDWLGATGPGFPLVHTPNLDRIFDEGVSFLDHYTDAETCHPARSSLLTGKPPRCHGALANGVPLPDSETTLAEWLKAAGWTTGGIGKIHSVAEGSRQGMDFTFGKEDVQAELAARGFQDWEVVWQSLTYRTGVHLRGPELRSEDVVTDVAVDAIGRLPEPWFLYVSYTQPHPDTVASDEAAQAVDPNDVPAPLPSAAVWGGRPSDARARSIELGMPWLGATDSRAHYLVYAAMIEEVDAQIGRILDALESSGRLDDTLIVFTTDHGDMAGQLGVFGKLYGPYEDVAHVPFAIRWPAGLPSGVEVHGFSQHSDLLPTLAELLERPAPAGISGTSMLPLLQGVPIHSHVVTAREADGVFRLRNGVFSYLRRPNGVEELYRIFVDEEEARDLSGEVGWQGTLQTLRAELDAWQQSVCR